MSEAFTVRLRTTGGRVAFWLAPAGGMGLSFPCCSAAHDEAYAAFQCGANALRDALNVRDAFLEALVEAAAKPLAS